MFGGRGEFGDGSQDAACGQARRAVGDAGGRDSEPGQQQSRVAQRAVIGVRGPAGAYQPTAWRDREGGGVDPVLLAAVARVGKVRRLRVLGYRDIAAVERPERGGLAGATGPGNSWTCTLPTVTGSLMSGVD